MWLGLALSYAVPGLPPSTAIIAIATASYLLAFLLTTSRGTTPLARAAERAHRDPVGN
jgi:hypothetical protein